MIRKNSVHQISVTLTDHIQLEARELAFLRTMAQHCAQTQMRGGFACERLDKLLADMGVPTYDDMGGGPVYGIFG